MKKYFIISCFLILLQNSPFTYGKNIDYSLDIVKTVYHITMMPFDLDGDGIDEFFFFPDDVEMDVTDFDFRKVYFSFPIPANKYRYFQPLPGSSKDTLITLFRHITSDSAVYELGIKPQGNDLSIVSRIIFTGKDRNGDNQYYHSLGFQGIIHNSKNEQLLLFRMNSGFDRAPRGLLTYDLKTKKIAWKFLVGPHLFNINITDIDNYGVSDIFCGSYAPENGARANGTSDDKSYLFAINGDGKLIWKRQFGDAWTGVSSFLMDLNGDGSKELVAYTFNKSDKPARDSLVIVDKFSGKIKNSYASGQRFSGFINTINFSNFFPSFDLDNDGKDEILVTTSSGFVWMFNEELELVKSSDQLGDGLSIKAVADLDGDGNVEILCRVNEDQLIVLNGELRRLASCSIGNAVFSFLAKRKNKRYIVLSQELYKKTKYLFLDFHPVYLPEKAVHRMRNYWLWLVLVIAILALIFLLREMFFGSLARSYFFLHLKNTELDKNTLLIYKKKKVSHIGDNWRPFLSINKIDSSTIPIKRIFNARTPQDLRKSIERLIRSTDDGKEVVFLNKNEYIVFSKYLPSLKSHALLLTDTTEREYIKQLKHWALVAQRLAHGIKNPLTTIKLNAEELQHELHHKYNIANDDINGFIDSIINQVNRLKKMSDGFMRFVEFEHPRWQSVNLNKEIEEKIEELRANTPKTIRIELDFEDNLPKIKIDREQFFHALSSVFYNAVESINDKGKIIISTSKENLISDGGQLLSHSSYVMLQIRDTGCGIPAEFLDKVTKPFFSRNKTQGTGLGLSIVQKIVEMHGGKLEIHSEINQGTLVSIWLPISNE